MDVHAGGGNPFLSDSAEKPPETQTSREAKMIAKLHKARDFDEELRPLSRLCNTDFDTAFQEMVSLHTRLSRPAPVLAIEMEERCIYDPPASMLQIGGFPMVNGMLRNSDELRPPASGPSSSPDICFANALWSSNVDEIHGLLEYKQQYAPFIKHLVFSLLRGRPVFVVGTVSSEAKIYSLIQALSIFVPCASSKTVIPWRREAVRMAQCKHIKLCGLPKQVGGNFPIPKAMERYVSVLDYEHMCFQGPAYEGEFLSSLFSSKRAWPDDATFCAHVYEKLLEVSHNALILYHVACMKSASNNSIPYDCQLRAPTAMGRKCD
eukprot:TRINITY_DN4685_c0_g3_i1.p1 TRINITY_DN4685_c0_g3~~TRINITY_DN4685_c0_g3_i1.p1  ORF type:complete len:369 (+),score=43.18 TRINITY_DN4685_c0_g3_i1:145-1107(+)